MSSDERRVHARTPVELKVTYKRLNTFFYDYTRNISKGGTFILTTKPLSIGTEFLFKLKVPELPEPLVLRGKVQWVVNEGQEDESGEGPGMGIEFLYDSSEDRASIHSIVERLMKKHLGERAFTKLMEKS